MAARRAPRLTRTRAARPAAAAMMPAIVGLDAFLLLALLVAALACFVFELAPVEVVGVCLLSLLVVSGLITLDEAVAGLSNKGVVTIAGLFVLSHALAKTGFLEILADRMSRRFATFRWVGVATLLAMVALLSGFLNNTAVVAMFLPLTIDIARRFELSPSKVLIPLSFASIFGGTLTLIGTSTNLLIGSVAERSGLAPLGMFEFTPLGLVFLGVGLLYVLAFAPRALPARAPTESLTRKYELASYLTEIRVVEHTKLAGKTVRELDLSRQYDVTVLSVLRGDERFSENLRSLPLRAGDILIVRGAMADLLRVRSELGGALLTDVKLSDREITGSEQVVVEAMIRPNSELIGRTLKEVDFRRHFRAFVLAVRRQSETLRGKLARTRLRFSDTLLLVTSRAQLEELRASEDLMVLSEVDLTLHRRRFWWLPILLIPAIAAVAALGLFELLGGVILSIALLLVLKVITPRESFRAVDWSVVLFIAAFIPVGEAMIRTGLAERLASIVLLPGEWLPASIAPWVALSVLYLFTSLLTETITNNAAAILITPVAVTLAHDLGVEPRPFVFAICFAASASFMTPTGYQTNLMVYGPGSYRFVDFTRFGAPLNVLFWIVATLLVPWFWPFVPVIGGSAP